MPHVVTQACCGDASCVFACPVNCIHPTPDEPDFGAAEMLYIDAATCVDCGACVSACPVGAIVPHTRLTADQLPFVEINDVFGAAPGGGAGPWAADQHRAYPPQAPVPAITPLTQPSLSVAIVGSGPAGMYAADELLKRPGVRVTVIDRLDQPYGLVRYGVAPDHQSTKDIASLFAKIERDRGFAYRLGVEVGRDVTHAELLEQFDAVLYASGASTDRPLDLPGVELAGCTSATDVVGWYNGHPDHVGDAPDLTGERAVVVGAGNVALDVARILTTDPERLVGTSIAAAALEALRGSRVREVVVLARRGAADAAFTLPELVGLLGRSDIEVVAENLDRPDGPLDVTQQRKLEALGSLPGRAVDPGARRVVLRFHTSPVAVLGQDRVTGIRVDGPDGSHDLEAGAVLRAIGYHGVPLPDLPFDDARGVVPNDRGRVGDRTYVVGWIKRGPTGFIGTNKTCAQETVEQLVQDANAGRLTRRKASVLAS